MDTRWFTDRIADKGLSQRELARRLGLDSSAISLTLRGKRRMKLTEAAQIARLLGVPVDDVLRHAGVHEISQGTQCAVVGIVDPSGEVRQIDERFVVEAPPGLPEGSWAVQSRTGRYDDGWLYFVQPPQGVAADAVGRFSLVQIRRGVQVLGRVSRGYRPGAYSVDGEVSVEDAVLEWAAPVLAIVP